MKLKPTFAELVYLHRRRLHLTQRDFAEIYLKEGDWRDVSNLENGLVGTLKVHTTFKLSHRITPWEQCVLLRRREGTTQAVLAERLGCSRQWLIQMEEGTAPSDKLQAYWGV